MSCSADSARTAPRELVATGALGASGPDGQRAAACTAVWACTECVDPESPIPEARTAAAKRPIVTRRIAAGPIRPPNFEPSHARVPLAAPTEDIAVAMHWMHIPRKG
jgi:hypothetical protein